MNVRAEAATAALIHRIGVNGYLRLVEASGEFASEAHKHTFHALAAWAQCGLQSVRMSHTYAAALMATSPMATEIRLPWPTFEIRVPDGLIATEQYGQALSLLVSTCFIDVSLYIRVGCSLGGFYAHALEGPLSALCNEDIEECVREDCAFPPRGDDNVRAGLLIRRLVANVCLDLAAHHANAVRETPRALKMDHRGNPVARGLVIGRPLEIDCRQAVRDYVSGARSTSPKCVTLVRGHWRNQPCGPRHALRQLIWIAPFYRGPDGAPLLVRPTHLGDAP